MNLKIDTPGKMALLTKREEEEKKEGQNEKKKEERKKVEGFFYCLCTCVRVSLLRRIEQGISLAGDSVTGLAPRERIPGRPTIFFVMDSDFFCFLCFSLVSLTVTQNERKNEHQEKGKDRTTGRRPNTKK